MFSLNIKKQSKPAFSSLDSENKKLMVSLMTGIALMNGSALVLLAKQEIAELDRLSLALYGQDFHDSNVSFVCSKAGIEINLVA